MARPVDPMIRSALNATGGGSSLLKALGSLKDSAGNTLFPSGALSTLGTFGSGVSGVGGLLGMYNAITNPNLSDYDKALGAAGGASTAVNAGSQLLGYGSVPGLGLLGSLLSLAGPNSEASRAATIASMVGTTAAGGVSALTGGLVGGAGAAGAAGGAAGGAAAGAGAGLGAGAASGVGALVALPAILGMLFGKGGALGAEPYDREGKQQLGLDALSRRMLGQSIASGETPDPTFVRRNINNVPLLSLYLGVSPEELGSMAKASHGQMSGVHNRETTVDIGGPIGGPIRRLNQISDPLALTLNPAEIPRYAPLYGADTGGDMSRTLLQDIALVTDAQSVWDKNAAEHAALGLAFDQPKPYMGPATDYVQDFNTA